MSMNDLLQAGKWTKGDWKIVVEGTGSARWLEVIGEEDYYDDHAPYVIATLDTVEVYESIGWKPTEDRAEVEATANLIAAAPDLYAALETLYAYAKEQADMLLHHPSGGSTVRAQVEAALAKARGES